MSRCHIIYDQDFVFQRLSSAEEQLCLLAICVQLGYSTEQVGEMVRSIYDYIYHDGQPPISRIQTDIVKFVLEAWLDGLDYRVIPPSTLESVHLIRAANKREYAISSVIPPSHFFLHNASPNYRIISSTSKKDNGQFTDLVSVPTGMKYEDGLPHQAIIDRITYLAQERESEGDIVYLVTRNPGLVKEFSSSGALHILFVDETKSVDPSTIEGWDEKRMTAVAGIDLETIAMLSNVLTGDIVINKEKSSSLSPEKRKVFIVPSGGTKDNELSTVSKLRVIRLLFDLATHSYQEKPLVVFTGNFSYMLEVHNQKPPPTSEAQSMSSYFHEIAKQLNIPIDTDEIIEGRSKDTCGNILFAMNELIALGITDQPVDLAIITNPECQTRIGCLLDLLHVRDILHPETTVDLLTSTASYAIDQKTENRLCDTMKARELTDVCGQINWRNLKDANPHGRNIMVDTIYEKWLDTFRPLTQWLVGVRSEVYGLPPSEPTFPGSAYAWNPGKNYWLEKELVEHRGNLPGFRK